MAAVATEFEHQMFLVLILSLHPCQSLLERDPGELIRVYSVRTTRVDQVAPRTARLEKNSTVVAETEHIIRIQRLTELI